MFVCVIDWLEIMYILLNNLLHAFCSALFFCITFGRIQICIGSDMNTWYFQFSPKHVSIKFAFVDEKYILLLTSYAYDFFNSLQVNEICICPLLILLSLKIKYPRKISALSFSRIAKSMLSYNFVCIVWPKEKAKCLGMWKKGVFSFPHFYLICETKTTTCIWFYFWCMISTNTSDHSYFFRFSTNTSIHTFLFSLFSNSTFSLHHFCFAKTNAVITRTEPGEGKLEYRCKSCKVMVCWRLHKRKISIFNGDCSSRQRGTTQCTLFSYFSLLF